jgi:membrane associated rhomboid family serine protease
MENVCGMIPFYSKDSPDQFYRIWTPIFLHAGLGHLVITVVFQYFIMRDIEKMAGPTRIAIIYLVSGIGGYLASAIFVPFRAEVCFEIVNYLHKFD